MNPAPNVGVFPFEGSGGLRVGTNVAQELAGEILDRGKNAASDHFALQPREPDLNLIEPGRIGGCEVKLHVAVSSEEIFDLIGLVCGQIIENDMNLLMRFAAGDNLFEETDEFGAGVPLGSLGTSGGAVADITGMS